MSVRLVRQIERTVREVRVAVVPGDELRGRMAAREVLSRNPEAAVRLRPHSVHDLVVVTQKVIPIYVDPERNIAKEPDIRLRRDPIILRGDFLDRRMVGRHALAHQAVRSRKPVEQVHRTGEIRGLEKSVHREEAGGARAHDSHAKRAYIGSE